MSFDPYIHFQGNCRAAMTAYQAIFGGDLQLMPYSDAPDGTAAMLASDYPPGHAGQPQAAVTINHTAPPDAEARRLFALLANGREMIMAYAPTFGSDGFGMVKDRFGTHSMVSAPWRQG